MDDIDVAAAANKNDSKQRCCVKYLWWILSFPDPPLGMKDLFAPVIAGRGAADRQPSAISSLWSTDKYSCSCSVTQSYLTLCDPMDCSPPGPSVHGIQARILEWVAISSSRRSSRLRDWIQVSCGSCIGTQILYHGAIWEAHNWQHCVNLRHIVWWFEIFRYCEMIITIRLVNTSVASPNYCVCMMKTLKIYCLRSVFVHLRLISHFFALWILTITLYKNPLGNVEFYSSPVLLEDKVRRTHPSFCVMENGWTLTHPQPESEYNPSLVTPL